MKYKVTLNGRTYEIEVEAGKAMLLDEYEAIAPAAPAAPAPAPALTHRTCPHHMATSLPPLATGPPKAPTSNSQVGREGQGSKFVATHPVTLRLTQGPS